MRNKHPVWSGILLLIIGGVIGYGIGLGIEVPGDGCTEL